MLEKNIFTKFLLVSVCAVNIALTCAADGIQDTFKLIEKKDWREAYEKSSEIQNHDLMKIVKVSQYLDFGYSENNFHEIHEFISHNNHWPMMEDLKIALEKSINDSSNLREVYNWFKGGTPSTSNGLWYYSIAASKYEKDKNILQEIIRSCWVKSNWSKEDTSAFLKRNDNYLRYNDHVAKIRNLITKGNFESAENLYYLTKPEDIKLFKIQIDLVMKRQNGVHAFEKLTKAQKHDVGTAIAYLHYFKKQKAEYHEKFHSLLSGIHDDGLDPRWTEVRMYFARDLMLNENFHKAYSIISENNPSDATDIMNSHHLAGIIAHKMKKYQDAIPHFKKCLEIAKRSSTIARANYWLGRCYSHKDKKLAKQYFAAAAKYDFVFYGQVGLLELGEKNVKLEEPNVTEHDFQHVKNSSLAHATKLVIKHGSLNLAAKYAEALVKAARNHSETAAAIKYISKLGGSPYIVGNAGRAAIDKGVFVKESFPAPFKVSKPLADLAVIYGVIRQESTYDQFALDPLDGRGLMQIMPETCKSVCKSLGIACDRNRLLSDASYNILVGSKLIEYHVKDFRHYVPSILSYNGGENRVKKWITKFGDLRRYNNFAKVVEWIEMVPLQITRTYVQKVLEVAQIYRTQFDNSNELQIQRYLTEKMDL